MMRFPVPFVALATAVLLIAPPIAHAESPAPAIVISELSWAGSSLNTADEWIELQNMSGVSVDLSNWTIDGAATSGASLTLPAGVSIAPGSTYLIANYDAAHASSVLARAPDFVTTKVSLSNSSLGLVLRDASLVERDRAGGGGSPFAGSACGAGSATGCLSMVRGNGSLPGNLPEAWRSADLSLGLDDGVRDLATPGFADLAIPVVETTQETAAEPAEETSETPQETPAVEEMPAAEPQAETPVVEPEPATEPVAQTTELVPDAAVVEETIADPVESVPEAIETLSASEETITTPVETPQAVDPEPTIETASVEVTETPPAATEEPAISSSTPVGSLIINELAPIPGDSETEFVEILNPFNNVIDLAGWKIEDGSGKATLLPDQLLGFGQLLLIIEPKGKLNNDADTVQLIDATGAVIDAVAYDKTAKVKKGESLVRVGNSLERTATPTPGTENILTAPSAVATTKPKTETTPTSSTPAATKSSGSGSNSSSYVAVKTETPIAAPVVEAKPYPSLPETAQRAAVSKPAARVAAPVAAGVKPVLAKAAPVAKKSSKVAAAIAMTIGEAVELPNGRRVSLTGKIVVGPKYEHAQTMFIEDETGKIQVYRYGGLDAALAAGDLVRVSGELSTASGTRRIKLGDSQPTVTGHEDIPAAEIAAPAPVAATVSGKDESKSQDATVGIALASLAAAVLGFRALKIHFAKRYDARQSVGVGA